jgi:hypothetical protein
MSRPTARDAMYVDRRAGLTRARRSMLTMQHYGNLRILIKRYVAETGPSLMPVRRRSDQASTPVHTDGSIWIHESVISRIEIPTAPGAELTVLTLYTQYLSIL